MAKSIKHQDKLRKLVEPGTDIETIGPVRVCFNQEFCIGTGCGGTGVYVGLHEDGSEVAVKRVIINKNEQLNININEKEILLHVKASKHIVNYRHFEYKQPFFFLIVDLCEETLENYVETHNEEHLKHHGPVIIREILTGLSALHSQEKKILHLDLKPQNILVDGEGHMRLADFGISRILNEEETTLTTGQMGTLGWMAAESIAKDGRRARFKRKSDIQVVGMISFYVLMKGKHPFGDDIHYRVTNIIEGNPVNLGQLSDSLARGFVASMISPDIKDRPSAEQALEHPFLKPGNADFGNESVNGNSFASSKPMSATPYKQERSKNLAMIPATVAFIKNDHVRDIVEKDGKDQLHQPVTFVGFICEVREYPKQLAYEIDDLTGGRITVKRWINKEENRKEYNLYQSNFKEDIYVRVYGHIDKVPDSNRKTIKAFCINRVVDFNEITYHMLAVIHARLKMKVPETIRSTNLIEWMEETDD